MLKERRNKKGQFMKGHTMDRSWACIPIEKRFWKYVIKTDTCWNWIGSGGNDGYGHMNISGKTAMAHRVSYEMLVGKIPKGLTIDHLCRNRRCVNPQHMEIVTLGINVLRGNSVSGINKRKTHCNDGHLFSKENTKVFYSEDGKKRRACRKCLRESDKLWYWKHKEQKSIYSAKRYKIRKSLNVYATAQR